MARRRTNLTPELVKEAIGMINDGKTKKQIERHLKISPATTGRIQQAINGIHRPDNANIRRLMTNNVIPVQKKDTHQSLSDNLIDASKALVNFKNSIDRFETKLIDLDDFLTEIHRKAKEIRDIL